MYRTFFSVILIVISFPVFSQISSPSGDFIATTSYKSTDINDSVYVFYADQEGETSGSLTAVWPEIDTTLTFNWYAFNESTLAFDILLQTDKNTTSTISGLEHGGYRVEISDGTGNDTSFTAYVFIDHFEVEIDKRADGSTLFGYRNCFQGRNILNLNARVVLDTLRYYDGGADENERWILMINEVDKTVWEAETDDTEFLENFNIRYYNDILLENPPVEDTDFFLTVTDRFGREKKDQVFYETIHVRAELDTSIIYLTSLDDPDYMAQYYDPSTKPDQQSLPQQIQFSAEESSSKATVFKWDFGNDSISTEQVPEVFTYFEPGVYTVKLTAYNADIPECYHVDSVTIDLEIAPEFELPKVLVIGDMQTQINGQTLSNKFRSYDVSVGYFEILIFNRYGKKVHEFGGYIRDWEGWDGSINNSDRKVNTGVYFYVITLEREVRLDRFKLGEFDDEEYRIIKDQKAGSIHVFNNN